jgi:hypothetical protein
MKDLTERQQSASRPPDLDKPIDPSKRHRGINNVDEVAVGKTRSAAREVRTVRVAGEGKVTHPQLIPLPPITEVKREAPISQKTMDMKSLNRSASARVQVRDQFVFAPHNQLNYNGHGG